MCFRSCCTLKVLCRFWGNTWLTSVLVCRFGRMCYGYERRISSIVWDKSLKSPRLCVSCSSCSELRWPWGSKHNNISENQHFSKACVLISSAAHINISVQLPFSLSHSPTPQIQLHSVNHASQIAPWSQSTLKWWKWIKLITDSQRESWQDIKSCVWPAAAHPSAMLYDGGAWSGSHRLSAPISINPPHLQTPRPLFFFNAPSVVRHLTAFIQVVWTF